MDAEHYNNYLKEKVAMLRLSHWDIRLEFVDTLDSEEKIAQITWNTDHHIATIELVKDQTPLDIKGCIVHELLHLRLAGHLPCESVDGMTEYAINVLSSLLV